MIVKNDYTDAKNLGYLILETGEVFVGAGYGAVINVIGELIFNTSLTGYQEIITDPSYKGQIVVFTCPHIGNVGVCTHDNQSSQVWTKSVITREVPTSPSNWRSEKSFEGYLLDNHVPGLAELDTRKLTKEIRDKGSLLGMVVRDGVKQQDALNQLLSYKNDSLYKNFLFSSYERVQKFHYCNRNSNANNLRLAVVDFGCKVSILNMLERYNCNISVLDSSCSFYEIRNLRPDAVILSNGPGDPGSYVHSIGLIKDLIKEQVPILGICLGHQLLGISLGAKIQKLQFGHHGVNHPVKDLVTNKVFITSQNHNYVINRDALPSTISITHISLFDNSIQGFAHNKHIFIGFQGHPEGGPGPIDIQPNVIRKFLDNVRSRVRFLSTVN